MGPEPRQQRHSASPLNVLTALGVVFGDLGTSPLYAMQPVDGALGGKFTTNTGLGVLSLIVQTLLLTISVNYCQLVMRADNHGEGGILTLMSLVGANRLRGGAAVLTLLGLLGTGLAAFSAVKNMGTDACHHHVEASPCRRDIARVIPQHIGWYRLSQIVPSNVCDRIRLAPAVATLVDGRESSPANKRELRFLRHHFANGVWIDARSRPVQYDLGHGKLAFKGFATRFEIYGFGQARGLLVVSACRRRRYKVDE